MFGFDLKSAKTENNREKAEGLKGKVADLYSPKKTCVATCHQDTHLIPKCELSVNVEITHHTRSINCLKVENSNKYAALK